MTTHRNVVFNAQTYREWIELAGDDVVLGVAPLFHITGLIGHIAISAAGRRAAGADVHRFDPSRHDRHDPRASGRRFTVGSITVFIALMNAPNAEQGRAGQR